MESRSDECGDITVRLLGRVSDVADFEHCLQNRREDHRRVAGKKGEPSCRRSPDVAVHPEVLGLKV